MINLLEMKTPETGEDFVTLAENTEIMIEAIVSSDRPEPVLYDQDRDEAVLLIAGGATLQIADEMFTMRPGDFLHIPAHTPHRVLRTEPGTRWLAVHSRTPLKDAPC